MNKKEVEITTQNSPINQRLKLNVSINNTIIPNVINACRQSLGKGFRILNNEDIESMFCAYLIKNFPYTDIEELKEAIEGCFDGEVAELFNDFLDTIECGCISFHVEAYSYYEDYNGVQDLDLRVEIEIEI